MLIHKAIHVRPRQTTTSVIKSNYFQLATVTLKFVRNDLSHIPLDLSCAQAIK